MQKIILVTGALLGGFGVILGAMGAHALRSRLTEHGLESFNTAVRYQIYHAFFLLFLFLLADRIERKFLNAIAILTVAGVILFSGSIYLLSTGELFNINVSFLGPVTPLGGLLLISAWFILAYSVIRKI